MRPYSHVFLSKISNPGQDVEEAQNTLSMADSIESEMTFGDLLSARTDSFYVPMVSVDDARSNSESSMTSDFVIGPRIGEQNFNNSW